MKRSYVAGAVAFALLLVASHLRSTLYNNYVLLAQAFLHGHTWINFPGSYIDALPYNGQHYVIEAPLPAVLLLPFAAIFGSLTNQTLLAVMLAGISIGAAWEICERLEVPETAAIWLCAFLLAGTDLMWCAIFGDVWFIAHVSAVTFTLLAIVELLGARRGWLVALWAVCAFESRFAMVLAVLPYAFLLVEQAEGRQRRVIGFASVLAGAALLWVGYNLARWGTPADIGYTAWYHQDDVGMPFGSPFQLRYLPYQLHAFFVEGFTFVRTFPFVIPGQDAQALTWTSPAIVLAFFSRMRDRLTIAMWAAALLCAAPNFIYYVDGFAQFGMRHALDFLPFLFVLMALACRRGVPLWGRGLIAYSCVVGLYGCWFWTAYYRAGF